MKSKITNYDELPVTLAVPDVSNVLGISLAGAYELVREKDFPAFKIGGRILVPKDKFLNWIDQKSSEKFGI